MALTQDAINDAKIAEAKVTNAQSLSDDYKRNLLNLITISTMATNGISLEEKILAMTDAIRILAISQVDFVTTILKTIINTIQELNRVLCLNCKAMKHADNIEKQLQLEELHALWQATQEEKSKTNVQDMPTINSDTSNLSVPEKNWTNTIKDMICQPGFWVFAILALLSPYTLDVINAIVGIFVK